MLVFKRYTKHYRKKLYEAVDTLSKESRLELGMLIDTKHIVSCLIRGRKNWLSCILLQNDKIIAFGQIQLIGTRCEIIGLFVRQEEQRKGYGTLLMAYLMGIARGLQAKEIHLTCYVRNKKGLKFYQDLGFKIDSQDQNSYWMKREIS